MAKADITDDRRKEDMEEATKAGARMIMALADSKVAEAMVASNKMIMAQDVSNSRAMEALEITSR